MKKISYLLILIILPIFLCSCGETVKNEIYNVTYEGSINISDFEELTQSVIRSTRDSVLTIYNYTKKSYSYSLNGTGSAVIYKNMAELKDGSEVDLDEVKLETINSNIINYVYYAVTNYHVVENSNKLGLTIKDSEDIIDANLLAYSSKKDIAVIKFKTNKYIPALSFGDSESLLAGSFVLAIGSPFGPDLYGTATFGIVSYPKRYIDESTSNTKIINEYIQHDASINSGNSGGPLVNMKGEIIGINTMKIAYNGEWNEGIGFSIPSNVIKEFINENVK